MRSLRTVLLAAAALTWACAPGTRTTENLTPIERDREDVLQRQSAWVDAAIRGDAAAFGGYMDDSYHRVGPAGRVRSKQEWMESIRSSQTAYGAVEYYNLNVRFHGDIAVVSGEYRQRASTGGRDNTGTGFAVHTWIRRDGEWLVLASIYPGTVGA